MIYLPLLGIFLLFHGCALSSSGFGNGGTNSTYAAALGATTGAIVDAQFGGTSTDRALSSVGGALAGGAIGDGLGGGGCNCGNILGSTLGGIIGSQFGGTSLDRALSGVGGAIVGGVIGNAISQ